RRRAGGLRPFRDDERIHARPAPQGIRPAAPACAAAGGGGIADRRHVRRSLFRRTAAPVARRIVTARRVTRRAIVTRDLANAVTYYRREAGADHAARFIEAVRSAVRHIAE